MITLIDTTTQEAIDLVHIKAEGEIISIRGSYESIMYRLMINCPTYRKYEPILAGTDLYTLYGPSHVIAVGNLQSA